MSRHPGITIAMLVLLLLTILTLCANVVAQTPSAAIRHFEAGVKENKKGNFDLAIEDFTIAIEISSHPVQRAAGKRVLSNPFGAFSRLRSRRRTEDYHCVGP